MATSNLILTGRGPNRMMTSPTQRMTNRPGPRWDLPVLSHSQELSTGIHSQIPIGQPPTHVNKLNRQLTRGKVPFTRPRMPSPADMEHPYHHHQKKKNRVLLLTRKTRLNKWETVVLQWFCQPFHQNVHLGVLTEYASRLHGVGSRLATSISSSIQK